MRNAPTTTTLHAASAALLAKLARRGKRGGTGDLPYEEVDLDAFRPLVDAGLAAVLFSATGNRAFATSAGVAQAAVLA